MAKLYWERNLAANFEALVRLVPDDVLDSPRRSVVPLLDFCRIPSEALDRLGRALSLDLEDTTDLVFEHAVPVQQGRGKSSFTDLLVLTRRAAVAIEAKYTEPEYESVKEWLGKGTQNRRDVLQGWLNLLGNAAGRSIGPADVQHLPYQLIHRAASACHADRPRRELLYLVFETAAPHYGVHVRSLADILGPCLTISIASCPLRKSASYSRLEHRWLSGERDMAGPVREALLAAPLFAFGDLEVEALTESSA